MPEMNNGRITDSMRKKRDLYHNYKKVIARHGELSSSISKSQLANEANNMPAIGGFYLADLTTVVRIINEMITLDRDGKLPDLYPVKTSVVDGWQADDPVGDWIECKGCRNMFFHPRSLPNGEPMPIEHFCPYCGSFIKGEDD